MSKRAAAWVSCALCAVLLAGCGAGSHAAAEESDGLPTATSTTAPAPTTTTVPPPYSFDGSVPPPPLLNTGTDYEAIYRCLSAYARWAVVHTTQMQPSPTRATPQVQPMTASTSDFDCSRRVQPPTRRCWRNIGRRRSEHHCTSSSRCDLTETVSALQLVDGQGQIVDSKVDSPHPLNWTVVMSQDTAGRWRIASRRARGRCDTGSALIRVVVLAASSVAMLAGPAVAAQGTGSLVDGAHGSTIDRRP